VPSRRVCPKALPPYLVLLRVGFAMPRTLLPGRCALTAPFHPYLACAGRYVLCGTFRQLPLTATARTLSGTPLCGVRTFLSRIRAAWQNQRKRSGSDRPIQRLTLTHICENEQMWAPNYYSEFAALRSAAETSPSTLSCCAASASRPSARNALARAAWYPGASGARVTAVRYQFSASP